MAKEKKRLWLIAILLIYVAIAVAGFTVAYMVKHYFFPNGTPGTNGIATTAPKAAQITPAHIPAGWKKYTNADLNIAFSYPSKDTIKASSYGFGVTSVTLLDPQGNTDFQILLLPKSLAQAVGQDFDSYYALPNNTAKVIKSPMSQDNTTEKFTKIRNRSVNGLQALDYQSIASNAPANAQPEIGTFIQAGNNVILISTGSGNQTTLEAMLSSFTYSG